MKIKPLFGYELLHHGAIALAAVEQNGIRIDIPTAKRKLAEIETKIHKTIERIKSNKSVKKWEQTNGDFNPNSTKQLADLLFNQEGLEPPKTTPGGAASVDVESLQQIRHPVVSLVLEMRKYEKMKMYVENIISHTSPNGLMHPFFHLHTTVTYRSSSSNINFQNIPIRDDSMSEIRALFVPRPGNLLLEFDYSGIEVRVAACYTHDQNLIRYITNPDSDMHRDVASQLFKIPPADVPKDLRRMVKGGFTFAQFYGSWWKPCAEYMWRDIQQNQYKIGGKTLRAHMRDVGIGTLSKFERHVESVEQDFWGNRFRQYAQWKQNIYNQYLRDGYIDTLTGFRLQGYMRRNAVTNYPIQGSAFHCLLWTLIHLQRYFDENQLKSKIIGQIHDSILIDVYPPELERVVDVSRALAEDYIRRVWKWIIVPLEIEIEITDVNRPWNEKHPLP